MRDYLMEVTTNLAIMNIDSIKLLATSLSQLTNSTNELTRKACVIMSVFSSSIKSYVFFLN
jgi:hypothetical protein